MSLPFPLLEPIRSACTQYFDLIMAKSNNNNCNRKLLIVVHGVINCNLICKIIFFLKNAIFFSSDKVTLGPIS